MKKRIEIIVVLLCLCLGVQAQQEANYSQYLFNKLVINPAYAGSRGMLNIDGLYRHQWAQIEGSPRVITVSLDAPIGNTNNNVGLSITNDNIGPYNRMQINGIYAYSLSFSKAKLNIGAQAGISNFNVNTNEVDGSFDGDPAYAFSASREIRPTFGAGAFFRTKKFAIGLSTPNLLASELGFLKNLDNVNTYANHYYLSAEYLIAISEDFKLKPATYVKYVSGGPVNLDLNLNLIVKDMLWVGGGYRTDGSYIGSLEVLLDKYFGNRYSQFRVGYAYDFSNKEIRKQTNGVHEIYLGFAFTKKSEKIISPRYF